MTESRAPFGVLLRHYRHQAGLTQAALAERARLSVRAVTDLERGARRAPHQATIDLLAAALVLAPGDRARLEAAARRSPPVLGPAAPLPPTNLPLALTSFVGREREKAAVRRLLAEVRLVTLTGVGGIGKTRLALEVAAGVRADFPDGVWLVELAPLRDPALVPQAIAAALGVREAPGEPLPTGLTTFLRPKRLLLLLDNCEHLVAASAALVAVLLRACPRLAILATSREALGVAGERPWRVAALTLPSAQGGLAPDHLLASEAGLLFVQRAQQVQTAFVPSVGTAVLVAQVCRRLDGIPLALELAAARLAVLPLETLVARLADRFRLLTGGSRTALPRQQTLRATLDWSYELLSEPERTLLRRLAVFAGGWTLEAAEAICGGDGVAHSEVLDLLAGLVQKSLVSLEERGAGGRYRLLETVREYGQERLVAAEETETVRDRHLGWYLALALEAAPALASHQQVAWLQHLEAELENVRAALAWSVTAVARQEQGLQLVAALYSWWYTRGHVGEVRRWLEGVLARGDLLAGAYRARALLALGTLAVAQRDGHAAGPLLEGAYAHFRGAGDRQRAADALHMLGRAAIALGEYGQAAARLEEGLLLYRHLGDAAGEGWALCSLGVLRHVEGDYGAAAALYEGSLAVHRAAGNAFQIGGQLANLAGVARDLGDFARARREYGESLAVRRALGDKPGFAECFEGLAIVAAELGQPERAARLFGAADQLREATGHPVEHADRVPRERTLSVVRVALGEAGFTAAWAEGWALSLEEAVALALTGDEAAAGG